MRTFVIILIFTCLFASSEKGFSQDAPTLIPVKCRGGVLMSKPDWQSEILVKVPPNQTILVFKDFYENDYYKARYKGYDGFITWQVLYPNDEVTAFSDSITTLIVKKEARDKIAARIQEHESAKENAQKRREYILKKYGAAKGNRILRKEYWIGMTSIEAIESIGEPERINRTTGSYGQREQWVYRGAYLYFQEGVLKSFQEFPTN